MENSMYDKLSTLDNSHWIVYAKYLFVKPYLGGCADKKILDAGTGSGAMLSFLEENGKVTAMDMSHYALTLAKKKESGRRACLICGDVAEIPIKDSSFDAVALLDVLYHRSVEDEDKVLRECRRVLKPGGTFVFIDSAFKFLKASYDDEVHAARRYTVRDVRKKFARSGFRVKKSSYVFFSIFPFVLAIRGISKLLPRRVEETGQFFSMNPVVNAIMRGVMRMEAMMLGLINLPFGVSVLCVGAKDGDR